MEGINELKQFIAHLEFLALEIPDYSDLRAITGDSVDYAFNLGCEEGEHLLAIDVLEAFKPIINEIKEM